MNDCSRELPTGAANCAHTSTTTEPMPPGSRHYARLKCANCGAFLKFLASPENVERRNLNAFRLAKLRTRTIPNSWERDFIDSLAEAGRTKLSPSQQAAFDEICLVYLKGVRQ